MRDPLPEPPIDITHTTNPSKVSTDPVAPGGSKSENQQSMPTRKNSKDNSVSTPATPRSSLAEAPLKIGSIRQAISSVFPEEKEPPKAVNDDGDISSRKTERPRSAPHERPTHDSAIGSAVEGGIGSFEWRERLRRAMPARIEQLNWKQLVAVCTPDDLRDLRMGMEMIVSHAGGAVFFAFFQGKRIRSLKQSKRAKSNKNEGNNNIQRAAESQSRAHGRAAIPKNAHGGTCAPQLLH